MFDKRTDALVQFRLPADWLLPDHIRHLGKESAHDRDLRIQRNEGLGLMESLLKRNGASLVNIRERIATAELKLVDAYAQVRIAPRTENRDRELPYMLLTFAFKTTGEEKSDAYGLFNYLTESRWEIVTVNANRSDGQAVFCVMAKNQVMTTKAQRKVDDPEADSFGIVVSKSQRKKQPEKVEANGPLIAWLTVVKTEPPKAKPPTRPKRVPNAPVDRQLNRLLGHNWQVDRDDGQRVHLFKMDGDERRTMIHNRRKTA